MDGYWDLFWATGSPAFYLLYRQEAEMPAGAKTAWRDTGPAVRI